MREIILRFQAYGKTAKSLGNHIPFIIDDTSIDFVNDHITIVNSFKLASFFFVHCDCSSSTK